MRFAFATAKLSAGGISVRRAILLAILFASVSNTAAAFNIYTVGSDAACAFTKIQDAVNAAAGHAGKDDVWIANNATYDNVQINVANQDVNIQGGFTSCSDQTITTNDQTTLHGGTSGPIFSITGTSNVYIGNLVITGAQRGSQAEGGGIVFTGSGSLMLQATTVSQNHAGYGAGIDISPNGNGATVTLMNDNIIDFNTAAVSGGGIRIEGKTDLIMASDHNLIFQNHALGQGDNGYGGGIEVIGPAHAEIGSPGYGTLPVIDANDAQYGGGIAILATSANNNAFVSMFTTDATRAVQMSNNTASVKGGAAYLHAFSSSASGHSTSSLCAVDYRINAERSTGRRSRVSRLGHVGGRQRRRNVAAARHQRRPMSLQHPDARRGSMCERHRVQ